MGGGKSRESKVGDRGIGRNHVIRWKRVGYEETRGKKVIILNTVTKI